MTLELRLLQVRTRQTRFRLAQNYEQVAYCQGQIDLLMELIGEGKNEINS